MPASFQTDQGLIVIPSTVVSYKVAPSAAGLATTGVVALIGEADQGPSFDQETDPLVLSTGFGPTQDDAVAAKYGSGQLVDGFSGAVTASNDPQIIGAPAKVILLKTNQSSQAKLALTHFDASAWGTIGAKSAGKPGNLINVAVTAATAEVAPTTGAVTYIPAVGTVAYAIRVDGAAAVGGTLAADTLPPALVTALDALAGVDATGGVDRAFPPASGNVTLTHLSGNAIQLDTVSALAVIPTAGDTFMIPAASVVAGAGNANVGAYVVTGASANQVLATKLSDAAKPSAVPGAVTAPVNVSSTALSGTPANDLKAFSPVVIKHAVANPTDGVGKSLEIAELGTGTDLLSRTLFQLASINVVTFVSKTSAPALLTSATEYSASMAVSKSPVSETLTAGGEIALSVGYTGTTASITVDDTSMTITVSGGAGTSLTITLKDHPTLADLASFIGTHTGYTASVGSGILGLLPPTALDNVTTGAATNFGAATARLKIDAFRMFQKVATTSVLVQVQDVNGKVVQPDSGLPQPTSLGYLAGGARGATTAASIAAAYSALTKLECNFVVPCFSRDAAGDKADGLTDASSDYTIAAINAGLVSHINEMQKLTRRKNRQGGASIRDTFNAARNAAANLANAGVFCAFEDVRLLAPDGTIKQQQPWMVSVLAAGMQSAAFYRNLTKKFVNISGALQAAGDFNPADDDAVVQALQSGLLVLRADPQGGWIWTSDQTTYGVDPNFFYNSIANVYIGNTIALTAAQRFDRGFIGQSVSDIPAALMKSFMEALGTEFLGLHLTAPSDDAPKGVKNIRAQIVGGNAAKVTAEWKINGALLFAQLGFLYSPVTQSA